MPQSYSNVQASNFELTPCRLKYNSADLGGTLGNVLVKVENSLAELKADQFGTSPLDHKVTGLKVTIETELAESQLKDNWKVVFPQHQIVTSGLNKLFIFQSAVGASMRALAKTLILHPLSRADSDLAGDVKIFLAAAEGKSEIPFSPSEQQKIKCVWNAYPDLNQIPALYMLFGDPAIGVVAAIAGTPGYTGTGNGTMTGAAAHSGVTKTETITATCIKVIAGSGLFHVVGSISGELGLATVGTLFSSAVVDFTINDGTIDFIETDAFTIAMTASNWA